MSLTLASHPGGWELTWPSSLPAGSLCADIPLPSWPQLSPFQSRVQMTFWMLFPNANKDTWLPCLGNSHGPPLPAEHEPRVGCSRSIPLLEVNLMPSLFTYLSFSPSFFPKCIPVRLHTLSFCTPHPPFLPFNLRHSISWAPSTPASKIDSVELGFHIITSRKPFPLPQAKSISSSLGFPEDGVDLCDHWTESWFPGSGKTGLCYRARVTAL